jgi:hypothetical protein
MTIPSDMIEKSIHRDGSPIAFATRKMVEGVPSCLILVVQLSKSLTIRHIISYGT